MKQKPKLLIVSASPRPYGASRIVARIAMKIANEEGAEANHIDVYEYRIDPCIGCVSDDVKLCKIPCVIDDDMKYLYKQVEESDGIIFVTPIYWYNIPGPLKNFIDRLTVFENMIFIEGRSRLEGKVVGFIAIGNDTGGIAVIQNLMIVLNSMGMAIPPWSLAYHHSKEEFIHNEGFLLDVANVVRGVVLLIKALKGIEKPSFWYLATPNYKEKILNIAKMIYEETLSRL